MDQLIEIYDKYHPADKIQSAAVFEHEISRCQKMLDEVDDQDIKEELNGRIEILEMGL